MIGDSRETFSASFPAAGEPSGQTGEAASSLQAQSRLDEKLSTQRTVVKARCSERSRQLVGREASGHEFALLRFACEYRDA